MEKRRLFFLDPAIYYVYSVYTHSTGVNFAKHFMGLETKYDCVKYLLFGNV